MFYDSCGAGGWTVGRQKTTNTFRWNYSSGSSYLVNDANTKMFLDTSGNLNMNGALTCTTINTGQGVTDVYLMNQNVRSTDDVEFLSLSINGDNTIINSINDSTTLFSQTPASLTGSKVFQFQSDTDNGSSEIRLQNKSNASTGHSSILLQTDTETCTGLGGNQCIIYDSCLAGGWVVGRQRTTNTFRWNYIASAGSYLVNDANTKMFLDTSGNLTCSAINTGQGSTEVYLMDQNVRTSDSPQFNFGSFGAAYDLSSFGRVQVHGTLGSFAIHPNVVIKDSGSSHFSSFVHLDLLYRRKIHGENTLDANGS